MSKSGSSIYDESEFYDAFIADMQSARGLILIASPFLGGKRINQLTEVIRRCRERNVVTCMFGQLLPRDAEPYRVEAHENATRKLLKLGVHVNFRKKVHEKLAIIDESILWDGSLNILSHVDTKERMTRTVDKHLVEQTILNYGLGSCETCSKRTLQSSIHPEATSIQEDLVSIGATIAAYRKNMGISQRELAEKLGIGQNVICQLEQGKRNLQMHTLLEVVRALRLKISPFPWYFGPSLDDLTMSKQINP